MLILLKYFEEDKKYPKLIVKPLDYFKSILEEQGSKLLDKIPATLIVNLIKGDDPFLEFNNPITSVKYYSEKTEGYVFHQ